MPVEPRKIEAGPSCGWFKATRGDDVIELIRTNRNAFLLAYIIAHRARWREGFNQYGLGQGEAMLGDFENYGMTQQQYRTAKAQLKKWKFATFKATSDGTIGKLIDTRLFSTSIDDANDPNNRQATNTQRASNERVTINEEGKKERRKEGVPAKGRKFLTEQLDPRTI